MTSSSLAEELTALGKLEDSIVATSDEFMHQRLDKILGRLVALSANVALRAKIIPIFSHILTRIKHSPTMLPCTSLLNLIRPEQNPFVINFSFTFLDLGIPNEPSVPGPRQIECAVALLTALSHFPPFSSHSNSLCTFVLPLLRHGLTGAAVSQYNDYCRRCVTEGLPGPVCNPLDIVSDYFIDIVLSQRTSGVIAATTRSIISSTTGITGSTTGLVGSSLSPVSDISSVSAAAMMVDGGMGALYKDGVGSISQGLSAERIHRMVGRKRDAIPFAEIRRAKYSILSSFCTSNSTETPLGAAPLPQDPASNSSGLLMCLPKHQTLFLLLVLSNDFDAQLAESAQEKLRGSKAVLFEKYSGVPSCQKDGTPAPSISLTAAVCSLMGQYVPGALSILPPSSLNGSLDGSVFPSAASSLRSTISDDLIAAVLKWISREVDICTSGSREGSLQVTIVLPYMLRALSHYYGLSDGSISNSAGSEFTNKSSLLLSKGYWLLSEKILEKCEQLLDAVAHPTAQRDATINYYDAVSVPTDESILGGTGADVRQFIDVLVCARLYIERSHLNGYWSNEGGEKFSRRCMYRAVESVCKIVGFLSNDGEGDVRDKVPEGSLCVPLMAGTRALLLQTVCTLVVTLFRCVDVETEDTSISTHLFQALHNLRELYIQFNSDTSVCSANMEGMRSLIVSSRVALTPKKRLMAYEWSKVLTNSGTSTGRSSPACVGWASPLTLETLLLLIDDPSALVTQALQLELAGLVKEMTDYQLLLIRTVRSTESKLESTSGPGIDDNAASMLSDYQYLHNVVLFVLLGFLPGGKVMTILLSSSLDGTASTVSNGTQQGIRRRKDGIAAFVKLANLSFRILLLLSYAQLQKMNGAVHSSRLIAQLITVLENHPSIETMTALMAVANSGADGVCGRIIDLLAVTSVCQVLNQENNPHAFLISAPTESFSVILVNAVSSLHLLETSDTVSSSANVNGGVTVGVAELIKYIVVLSTASVRIQCMDQLQTLLLLCSSSGCVHMRSDQSVQAIQFLYTAAGCIGLLLVDPASSSVPGGFGSDGWRDNLVQILAAKSIGMTNPVPLVSLSSSQGTDSLAVSNPQLNSVCNSVLALGFVVAALMPLDCCGNIDSAATASCVRIVSGLSALLQQCMGTLVVGAKGTNPMVVACNVVVMKSVLESIGVVSNSAFFSVHSLFVRPMSDVSSQFLTKHCVKPSSVAAVTGAAATAALSTQVFELQRKGAALLFDKNNGLSLVDKVIMSVWLLHQPLVSGAAIKTLIAISNSSSNSSNSTGSPELWQFLTKSENMEILVSRCQITSGVAATAAAATSTATPTATITLPAAPETSRTTNASATAARNGSKVVMPVPIYSAIADSLVKLALRNCLISQPAVAVPSFCLHLDHTHPESCRVFQLVLYLEQLFSMAVLSSIPTTQQSTNSASTATDSGVPASTSLRLSAHVEEGFKTVCAMTLLVLVDTLHATWLQVPVNTVVVSASAGAGASISQSGADKWSPAAVDAVVELLLRCSRLYLHLIRDRSLHVQDVTCLGLCHIYELAKTIEQRSFLGLGRDSRVSFIDDDSSGGASIVPSSGKRVVLADAIAEEVICTLTKEKRIKPIVGYEVGATSSDSTRGATGDDNIDGQNINLAALQEQVVEALREAQGNTEQQQVNADAAGTAATGGGGSDGTVDVLAQVEELAANLPRVNMNINAGTRTVPAEETKDNFAAYATICKVAYKAGGAPIVFAVLGLIRKNNILGSVDMEVALQPYELESTVLRQFDYDDVQKLIAMLFMARYDPSPTVRSFMNQLWAVIVVDSKHYATLMRTEQKTILQYCMQGLLSGVWRDRESACRALEAYLPDKSFSTLVFPHLTALFDRGLRAMDDVRDTTRVAALGFMKVLGDHIVYAAAAPTAKSVGVGRDNGVFTGIGGGGSAAAVYARRISPETVLSVAMPLLLDKGLLVTFPEGKGYTMGLLIRLIKESKSSLDRWVVRLISVLVEAMSGFEPQSLQYMSFHTTRLNILGDELESMRVKMAQSSPLQEALTQCLQHTDMMVRLPSASITGNSAAVGIVGEYTGVSSTSGGGRLLLTDVLVSLCDFLQRGVGLATRVTAANSLCTVVEKYTDELLFAAAVSANGGGVCAAQDRMEIAGVTEKAFYIIYHTISSPSVASSKALQSSLQGAMGSLVKIIDPRSLRQACLTLLDRQRQLDVESTIGSSSIGSGGTEEFQAIAVCINQIVARGGERMVERRSDVERNDEYDQQDAGGDGYSDGGLGGSEADGSVRDRDLWKMLLSRAYIGMFDTEGGESSEGRSNSNSASGNSVDSEQGESALVSAWKATWTECLVLSGYGVKSSALVRILGVLLGDIATLFSSLSWRRRAQAMAVLADVVTSVSASSATLMQQVVGPNMGILVRDMLRNIQLTNSAPAYVWAGKDRVVEVLLSVLVRLKDRVCYNLAAAPASSAVVTAVLATTDLVSAAVMDVDEENTDKIGVEVKAGVMVPVLYLVAAQGQDNGDVLVSTPASSTLKSSADVAVPAVSLRQQSMKSLSCWRVDMRGLVRLLLLELVRSSEPVSTKRVVSASSTYRIAVARALAALEWYEQPKPQSQAQFAAVTSVGCSIYLEFLPALCAICKISLEAVNTTSVYSCLLSQLMRSSAIQQLKTVQATTTTAPAMAPAVSKPRPKTRPAPSLNMFGSRYSSSSSSSKKSVAVSKPTSTATSGISSTVSVKRKLHVEDSSASTVITASTSTASSNVSASVSTSESVVATADVSVSDTSTLPGQSLPATAAATNTTFPSPDSASTSSSTSSSEDTAILTKVLESIVHGWPARIGSSLGDSAAVDVVSCYAVSLVHWCLNMNLPANIASGSATTATAATNAGVGAGVGWSIRRVSFQLLKAILLSHPGLGACTGASTGASTGAGLNNDDVSTADANTDPYLQLLVDLVTGPQQLLLTSVAHIVGEDKKHTLLITAALQCTTVIVQSYAYMYNRNLSIQHSDGSTPPFLSSTDSQFLSRSEFVQKIKSICETTSSRYSLSPPVAEELAKLQLSLRKTKLI